MLLFILKRIGFMALTMLAVSVVLFALLEIDKEKVAVRVIGQYTTPEQRALWLERNGYNRPIVERYVSWLGHVAIGDFGRSVRYQSPVADVLWPRVWNTVILATYALGIIVPLSLVLGILAGNAGRAPSSTGRSRSLASAPPRCPSSRARCSSPRSSFSFSEFSPEPAPWRTASTCSSSSCR